MVPHDSKSDLPLGWLSSVSMAARGRAHQLEITFRQSNGVTYSKLDIQFHFKLETNRFVAFVKTPFGLPSTISCASYTVDVKVRQAIKGLEIRQSSI